MKIPGRLWYLIWLKQSENHNNTRLDKHVKVANAYPYSTLSVILFSMPCDSLVAVFMYYMLLIAWYIVLRNNRSHIWKGFNLYSKVASPIKQAVVKPNSQHSYRERILANYFLNPYSCPSNQFVWNAAYIWHPLTQNPWRLWVCYTAHHLVHCVSTATVHFLCFSMKLLIKRLGFVWSSPFSPHDM